MTYGLKAPNPWRGGADVLFRCLGIVAFVGLLAFSAQASAGSTSDAEGFKLAPGDRINVTVFGQPEMSGELSVDGSGNITLPFIGLLDVANLTVLECQKLIRDRLADGLLNEPSVSVRVSEPRPLAVLGDVRAPGVYPFRYGSTVKSAVAAAGGFGAGESLQATAVPEFILADERVHQLTFQRQALLVREARLEAVLDGKKVFIPPSPTEPDEKVDTEQIVAQEKQAFEIQVTMLQNQLDLLRSQKPRIETLLTSYAAEIASAKKQLDLVSQNANDYTRLVKQGLGVSTQEMQLKLNEATQENEVWRLTTESSRLEMDLGELDLKLQQAQATFNQQVVTELREVREKLRDVEVSLPSARELRLVRLQQADGLASSDAKRAMAITRMRNGEVVVLQATETTPVEPGDVIEVKKAPPPEILSYKAPIPSNLSNDRAIATVQETGGAAASK